jgi:hypothetical protein
MDLHTPAPSAHRDERMAEYVAFLADRNGTADAGRRTLPRREAALSALSSGGGRFDATPHAALFHDQYGRFDAARPTPAPLLLLLAFVKTNALEAYAVDAIERVRLPSGTLNAIECELLLEESYHTRILLGAAEAFGLRVQGVYDPPAAMKVLTQAVVRLPMELVRPLSLASELFGLVTFSRLLRAVRVALADMPELRDAMEQRLLMVLTDEIGHVAFQRLQVSDAGFRAARAMLPFLTGGFAGTFGEVDRILGDRLTLDEVRSMTFDKLPQEARSRAFVA